MPHRRSFHWPVLAITQNPEKLAHSSPLTARIAIGSANPHPLRRIPAFLTSRNSRIGSPMNRDRGKKTVSLAGNRLDVAWCLRVVAQRVPNLADRHPQAVVEFDEGMLRPKAL